MLSDEQGTTSMQRACVYQHDDEHDRGKNVYSSMYYPSRHVRRARSNKRQAVKDRHKHHIDIHSSTRNTSMIARHYTQHQHVDVQHTGGTSPKSMATQRMRQSRPRARSEVFCPCLVPHTTHTQPERQNFQGTAKQVETVLFCSLYNVLDSNNPL